MALKRHLLLVFEVLSPSTEKIDLREKFVNYRRLPSLREFVSVHQDCRRVVCCSDGFGWNAKYLVEDGDVLHLPSIDLEIPLQDIYHKVALEKRE